MGINSVLVIELPPKFSFLPGNPDMQIWVDRVVDAVAKGYRIPKQKMKVDDSIAKKNSGFIGFTIAETSNAPEHRRLHMCYVKNDDYKHVTDHKEFIVLSLNAHGSSTSILSTVAYKIREHIQEKYSMYLNPFDATENWWKLHLTEPLK